MPPELSRLRPASLRLPALLLGVAALLARPAAGSLLVPLDTAQLTARAERIVVGTVVGQESRWTEDGGAIVTDVRIRVTTALHGAREGEVVTVRRLGGVVKDVGMRVFGEASFQDGEEVLLFAERRGDAYFSVGMTQGTMHIVREGGRRVAQATLAGAELLGRGSARPLLRPLDEVIGEVRAELAKRPKPVRKEVRP